MVDAIAGVRGTRIFKKGDLIDWGVLWHQRGIIEPPPPPGAYEDKFNYANDAAMVAAGWVVLEPGGPTDVQMVGGTAVQLTASTSLSQISKTLIVPAGAYNVYFNIIAETNVGALDAFFNMTGVGNQGLGLLSANPGVYQLGGGPFTVTANPTMLIRQSTLGRSTTIGGIMLVPVVEETFTYADDAAMVAAGWTVSEAGGPTDVQMVGGTAVQLTASTSLAWIQRTMPLTAGVYNVYFDIIAETNVGAFDIFFNMTGVSNTGLGLLSANPGVYQLVGGPYTLAANPLLHVRQSILGRSTTIGGIMFVRVA